MAVRGDSAAAHLIHVAFAGVECRAQIDTEVSRDNFEHRSLGSALDRALLELENRLVGIAGVECRDQSDTEAAVADLEHR